MIRTFFSLIFLVLLSATANAQIEYRFGEWHFFSDDRREPRHYRNRERDRILQQEKEHEQNWFEGTLTIPDPEIRQIRTQLEPGTVYISTKNLMLYYILSEDQAVAYPVALGKEGFGWQGTESVTAVKHNPSWRPPLEMRRRKPSLPEFVPGGHPRNPLGVAAIYLGDTLYRIHGTDAPQSIGKRVSSGCIRMYNSHVLDLIKRVEIGTKVVVE